MRPIGAIRCTVVIGFSLLCGCSEQPVASHPDHCATRLAEVPRFNDDLEEAIKRINPLLEPKHRIFALTEENRDKPFPEPIPAYTARASVTGDMVAQVPYGCPEIVFNAEAFYHGLQQTMDSTDNAEDMLAFLLLHEVGHIANEHYGQFLPVENSVDPNIIPSIDKDAERQADQFVIDLLRPRIANELPDETLIAHRILTFIGLYSFTIAGTNSINCFGCRPLGSTDIFWDHSRTHENLELRLLKINHGIHPSDTGEKLLRDFEASRDRQHSPEILYRSEPEPDAAIGGDNGYGLGLGLGLGLDLELNLELETFDDLIIRGETDKR